MRLLDHFHSPFLTNVNGMDFTPCGPATIVRDLNSRLPSQYVAQPGVRIGTSFEIDVAARKRRFASDDLSDFTTNDDGGGLATAVWAPPLPTLTVESDIPKQDEYEVNILDATKRRIVASH